MRKKKETPLKTRGRPKNSGLLIPSWAGKAITELATKSGVTSQKILEVALRDGIQLVGEPLGAWIKYGESSERLWNEHVTNPEKVDRPQPAEAPSFAGDPFDDDPEGQETTVNRLDDADELRGLGAEVQANNGALDGE